MLRYNRRGSSRRSPLLGESIFGGWCLRHRPPGFLLPPFGLRRTQRQTVAQAPRRSPRDDLVGRAHPVPAVARAIARAPHLARRSLGRRSAGPDEGEGKGRLAGFLPRRSLSAMARRAVTTASTIVSPISHWVKSTPLLAGRGIPPVCKRPFPSGAGGAGDSVPYNRLPSCPFCM